MAHWDLSALLNAADPRAPAAEQHLWLVRWLQWLRWPGPPIQVDRFSTSGSARTISSIWRTFASVRSRLAPTGMRSARRV